MNDQVLVCVSNPPTNRKKKPELLVSREFVRRAVLVNANAFDVLHGEKRLAIRAHAAVQEMRNVWMI